MKALLENATSQLDSIKTDLSEKVHSENVKCYRNIQDLFNEFDSKIEKMENQESTLTYPFTAPTLFSISSIFSIL